MLEDVYYLQNQLLMKGLAPNDFDESDYFEITKGLSARSPEDRPEDMEDFIKSLLG